MKKTLYLLIALMLISFRVYSDVDNPDTVVVYEPITVEEEDASPAVTPTVIKFPNGSVTNNGDDSVSVSFSGGGGGLASTDIDTSAELSTILTDETGTGALVFANTPTLVTPVLGTPTSGTLTNCTGLPVSGITASTSTALGVGSVELGHATDTTLSRSSAGVLAVEGVVIPSISSTNTLSNKRMTRRVVNTTQSATPTINTDNTDVVHITGLAQAITSMTTNLSGTPVAGDMIEINITDNGTGRAITWGASFEASATVALPTTTTASTRLDVVFIWNEATSKWRCVGVA